MTRIIAIINNKGGVNKTTLTTFFASIEAVKGNKVLIIDLDNQGNVSTTFGLNADSFQPTVYDILLDGEHPGKAIVKVHENLDVIPAGDDMVLFELHTITDSDKLPRLLYMVQDNFPESFLSRYDFVFFDLPPSLGILLGNAMAITDEVIIPVVPEPYAKRSVVKTVEAVRKYREHLENPVDIKSILFTNVEKVNIHDYSMSDVRRYADEEGIYCVEGVIKKSKLVPDFISNKAHPHPITLNPLKERGLKRFVPIKLNYEEVWREINGER